MTKQEQIREHLSKIRNATTPGALWGAREIVSEVQGHLAAIRELLKPEPERQASLVNICNQLGRENATLRNDLTDMTLNYNMTEKHARRLEDELASSQTYVGSLADACNLLKKRNDQLEQNLTTAETMLHTMQQRVKSLRAVARAEVTDLRATNVQLLRRNKELDEDLKEAEAHIEGLQEDLVRKNEDLDAAFRNNDILRSTLALKNKGSDEADARIVVLKRRLDLNDKYLTMLERARRNP